MTNQWIDHIKDYSKRSNMSYNEALKCPKCRAEYNKKVGGNLIRNIIYKPEKFNPSKMTTQSKYIKEGKYMDKHLLDFKLSERKTEIKKQHLDENLKKLYEFKNRKTKTPSVEDVLKINKAESIIQDVDSFMNTSRKPIMKTLEQQELFKSIIDAIQGFDFYATPSIYSDMIFKNVNQLYKNNDKSKIKVLDIASGLLSLSMPFIKNNYDVELVELNYYMYSIIKPFEALPNVEIKNDNFIELKNNYYYNKNIDVIIMNPPFAGSFEISDELIDEEKNEITKKYIENQKNKNGKNYQNVKSQLEKRLKEMSEEAGYKPTKVYYLYFIIKAIDILYNSNDKTKNKFLFVICPQSSFKYVKENEQTILNIPKTVLDDVKRLFKIDYWNKINVNITFLSKVSGFRTVKNGRPTSLNATFGLYKFEINTHNNVKNGGSILSSISNYASTVFNGRNDLPPSVRDLLEKGKGDRKILKIEMGRTPVDSLLTGALSAFSGGKFGKRMYKNFDELFHLYIKITLDDNKIYALEKNAVISLTKYQKYRKNEEVEPVYNVPSGLTLNKILENTKNYMGSNFLSYNAVSNNCQDFIVAVFKSNNIGDAGDIDFIKQDTEKLFKKLPVLQKIANFTTDLGAKFDEIAYGAGIKLLF